MKQKINTPQINERITREKKRRSFQETPIKDYKEIQENSWKKNCISKAINKNQKELIESEKKMKLKFIEYKLFLECGNWAKVGKFMIESLSIGPLFLFFCIMKGKFSKYIIVKYNVGKIKKNKKKNVCVPELSNVYHFGFQLCTDPIFSPYLPWRSYCDVIFVLTSLKTLFSV